MPRTDYREEFDSVRPMVLERDGHLCRKCGRDGDEVHHINGHWDNDPEQMRTLCRRYHLIAPMGADYWVWERHGADGWEDAAGWVAGKMAISFAEAMDVTVKYEPFAKFTEMFRSARARKKAATGRCEGAKPYGEFPGETSVLEHMRRSSDAGVTPAGIARLLNAGGVKTRRGKAWPRTW